MRANVLRRGTEFNRESFGHTWRLRSKVDECATRGLQRDFLDDVGGWNSPRDMYRACVCAESGPMNCRGVDVGKGYCHVCEPRPIAAMHKASKHWTCRNLGRTGVAEAVLLSLMQHAQTVATQRVARGFGVTRSIVRSFGPEVIAGSAVSGNDRDMIRCMHASSAAEFPLRFETEHPTKMRGRPSDVRPPRALTVN